jgi:hypothetical protein
MTSVVKYAEILTEALRYKPLFLVRLREHTRVSAETGPVMPTVDPADIRGLGTTVL